MMPLEPMVLVWLLIGEVLLQNCCTRTPIYMYCLEGSRVPTSKMLCLRDRCYKKRSDYSLYTYEKEMTFVYDIKTSLVQVPQFEKHMQISSQYYPSSPSLQIMMSSFTLEFASQHAQAINRGTRRTNGRLRFDLRLRVRRHSSWRLIKSQIV